MIQDDQMLEPSANGILHCLKLLAAEAATLNLVRTLSAIEDALEMAFTESGLDMVGEGMLPEPPRPVLH